MPIKAINILKSFFNTGDKPSESNFEDLIDSFLHKSSGKIISNATNANGVVSFSFSDNTSITFDTAQATSQEISFINGLQEALNAKVTSVVGKALSTNDFTNALKTKLDNLSQVELPESYDIGFIVGLQNALNTKANDEDVVKSVTLNGTNYTPDAGGLVGLSLELEDRLFNLTGSPSRHNYNFFGGQVFTVAYLLDLAITDVSGELKFEHEDNIGVYVKTEVRSNKGVLIDFTLIDSDVSEVIIQDDNFNSGAYLLIEYTILSEGIGVDEIGVAEIG